MTPTLRRFAYAVFGVACTHLVFGAIVRISGSGMGCGPHWPKCYGRWFPPMDRPDLVIEVTHRYLASILLLSLIALSTAAWRRRAEAGVGGRGGVLRAALLATALGFSAAILGAVTVKFGNAPLATVAHWTVAMSLVAAVTATVIRAGGLGGDAARMGGASGRTRRASLAGAGMALAAVVMGGLTAKVQGGPIACLDFPLCGANPAVPRGAVHVQGTHRVIAVLLVLHLIGLFFALRKRRETPVVRRAAAIALGLGVLQLLIAGAMIGLHLPPVLRSLHEATGVSIWIATFALAYLARLASDDGPRGAALVATPIPDAPMTLDPLAAASVGGGVTRAPIVATDLPVATSGAVRRAGTEVHARATPATALAPVVEAPAMAMAYRPPMAAVRVAPTPAPAAEMPPVARPAIRLADAPIELPAALERASASASSSALAFHGVAATATMAASVAESELIRNAMLDLGAPPSELDTVTSTLDCHQSVAEIIVSVGDAGAATSKMKIAEIAEITAIAEVEEIAESAETALSTAVADSAMPVVVRDEEPIVLRDEELVVDELYNLRGLDVDEELDAELADALEAVATLDEEFSQLAIAEVDAALEEVPGVLAPEPVPALAPPVRAPMGTLSEISAARRPAMSHSIAVIVARGAEF